MKDHHYSQDSMEVSGINNQKRSENISSTGAERSAAGRAKAEERSESAETKKAEALARREAAQSEGRGRSLDESA